MENTYPNRCEEVLAHHGVLGMKWGVRRYQNPDGSLTAAGKKRYFGANGMPSEEGKRYIAKSAKKYAKKSKTLKELNKKRNAFETRRAELNYFANKHASQVTKIRPEDHMRYLTSDNPENVKKAVQYLDAGHKYMDDAWKSSNMDEKYKDIKNLQRQFEKETRSFVENLLGEQGNTKIDDPMAIKVNLKTKEVMQSTLADAETIRISRMYAGLWDVD